MSKKTNKGSWYGPPLLLLSTATQFRAAFFGIREWNPLTDQPAAVQPERTTKGLIELQRVILDSTTIIQKKAIEGNTKT